MPVDPTDNAPTRVSNKIGDDGRRTRVSRRSGSAWEGAAKAGRKGGDEE